MCIFLKVKIIKCKLYILLSYFPYYGPHTSLFQCIKKVKFAYNNGRREYSLARALMALHVYPSFMNALGIRLKIPYEPALVPHSYRRVYHEHS